MIQRQRLSARVGSPAGVMALVAFAALAASPRDVVAQTVVGSVLEAETGRPVAGALVELLGSDGSRLTTALTDAAGRFVLRPGVAGTYSLRVEQIGRRTTMSGPFDVAAGESVSRTVRLSLEAISLEAIEVPGEQRCRLRPEVGEVTARLWNEARKALEIARWVDDSGALDYRVLRFRRTVDPGSGRVLDESSSRKSGFSDASPFVSSDPDSLARLGFVWRLDGGDLQYHAPDAHVLLSDAFLDRHCFRVRQDGAPSPGLIGLAFEPVDRRAVTDIHGVLWLDRRTAELRSLEYRYDRLPGGLMSDRIGGTLVFERLPRGPFIVRRWEIRMPLVGIRQIGFAGQREREPFLHRLVIEGGEVLEARSATGDAVIATELAAVAGTVYDSVAGAPISDAIVRLGGTDRSARTDSAGRFAISGVSDGRYAIVATSPRLDSLGIAPLRSEVELRRGDAANVALATPSLVTLLAQDCVVEGDVPAPLSAADPTYGELREGGGILVGYVRNTRTGHTLSVATVFVSWTVEDMTPVGDAVSVESASRTLEIPVNTRGLWRACRLPWDVRLEVHAEVLGVSGDRVDVRLTAGEIRRLDLEIPVSRP